MHRVSLRFIDPALERAFRTDYRQHILPQARIALALAASLYLLLGLKDPWFFPDNWATIWTIRGVAAAILLGVAAATWLRPVQRHLQAVLLLTTLGVGSVPLMLVAQASGPQLAGSYALGLMLALAWIYTLSGMRFLVALLANVLLLALAGMVLAGLALAGPWLGLITLQLIASSILLAAAGYMVEWQRRTLYYQATRIDGERRSHAHQALHDALTGLPNRLSLEPRMQEAMGRARRSQRPLACLFIDINEFKPVNDRYGHRTGDNLLAQLAQRLQEEVRETDMVFRFGGDEFVVLAEGMDSETAAEHLADKLVAALERGFVISADGQSRILKVGASIGVACYPGDAGDSRQLLQYADVAMYQAKQREGTSVCRYQGAAERLGEYRIG